MNSIKDYDLVFTSNISISNKLVLFIFSIIVVIYFIYKIKELKKSFITFTFIKFVLYFFLIGLFLEFITSIYETYKVKDALKNNSFLIVKGTIKKFHPMSKFGHDYESFIVNDIIFKIPYTDNSPGKKTLFYSMIKNMDGPIKENNQQVVIYYIQLFNSNKIIQLYIKK